MWMQGKRGLLRLGLVVAVVLGLAEVAASWATRPKVYAAAGGGQLLEGAQAPAVVRAAMARSCQDCHSDGPRYPWYSYVYPVSQLVSEDVEKGRQYLNLSQWAQYPAVRKQRVLSGIANQIRYGEMPLEIYVRLHPEAKLSEEEKSVIYDWTQAERLRLILEQQ